MQPLEDYLAEIEVQLATLPAERREAQLREIRLHLQLMVEDYIAIGDSPEEAVAAALRQFGSSSKLGRELKGVQRQDKLRRWRPLLAGLAWYGANIALYGSFCSLIEYCGFLLPRELNTPWSYHIVLVISGLVGGWIAESVAPRKAIWSVVLIHLFFLFNMRPSTGEFSLDANNIVFILAGCAACFGIWLRQRRAQKQERNSLVVSN